MIPPCGDRLEATKNGKVVSYICNNPNAPKFKKLVDEGDCLACPVRMADFRNQPDGSLIVPARGKPPMPPPGYIQDPGDQYRFIKAFPECSTRNQVNVTLPCGKKKVVEICKNMEAPTKNLGVVAQTCIDCPFRK